MVDDVRVRAIGRTPLKQRPKVKETLQAGDGQTAIPVPVDHELCYWECSGRVNTPVHKLAELKAGDRVKGEENPVNVLAILGRGAATE